jgi:DNA integrity scanning protein DisA with diadenylate cyclase activity
MQPLTDGDHVLGPEGGIVLVQYGDFECPQSREVYRAVREIREAYPGRVRYGFRHFPLQKVHPHAERAAMAAEAAAAQGGFWAFADRLYEHQDRLSDADLARHATAIGLDGETLLDHLADDRHYERVRAQKREGVKAGVRTTAHLFIDGELYQEDLQRALTEHVVAPLLNQAQAGAGAPKEPDGRLTERLDKGALDRLCREQRRVPPDTLERVLTLAVEIAREGREGRKIGTVFTVGDHEAVLERSRPMVLDPLLGHSAETKRLTNPDMRETAKELAQLDGAFVVSDEGVVLTAARYLDAPSAGVDVPLGLGSRHMAAASITRATDAVAVVVSESAVVRVFEGGAITSEIIPELWLMSRYGTDGDGEWQGGRREIKRG